MEYFKKRKKIYTAIAIGGFILTVAMGEIYRPWIYRHDVNDFGIAGSAPSFCGLIVAVFFFARLMKPKDEKFKNILAMGIGGILYEFIQPYVGLGVFDLKDLIGIVLGFIIASLIILQIWKFYPREEGEKA